MFEAYIPEGSVLPDVSAKEELQEEALVDFLPDGSIRECLPSPPSTPLSADGPMPAEEARPILRKRILKIAFRTTILKSVRRLLPLQKNRSPPTSRPLRV